MQLAISNIAWSCEYDGQMYKMMEKYGFGGLEIAPTRIFEQKPYDCLSEGKKWAENLRTEYGLSVVSLQSIWYGRNESLFGSYEERQALLEYTKRAIDFACAVGAKNIVFGCPKNRKIPMVLGESFTNSSKIDTYYNQALNFFSVLGDYAASNGVVIGMEANPVMYNTNFINTTLEALNLVKQVDSLGFRLNLDIGTMLINNEPIGILTDNVDLISHVHVSEPGLEPVKHYALHDQLAELLAINGYSGYVSIEMKKCTDLSVIYDSLDYIRSVFGEYGCV